MIDARIRTPEMMYEYLRLSMNENLTFCKKFSENLDENEQVPRRSARPSSNTRVMKIEQKSEVMIPSTRVVAKPLTGPVPKKKRTAPVMIVVRLPSMIAEYAFLKPSLIASIKPLPPRNSSLIRSKMMTLASTAIPIVSTIPAIPGSVNTAPVDTSTPMSNNTLNKRAALAIQPAVR